MDLSTDFVVSTQALLAAGADVKAVNSNGWTALLLSIVDGHARIVKVKHFWRSPQHRSGTTSMDGTFSLGAEVNQLVLFYCEDTTGLWFWPSGFKYKGYYTVVNKQPLDAMDLCVRLFEFLPQSCPDTIRLSLPSYWFCLCNRYF